MTLSEYVSNLNQRYRLGNATEHTYRGDLGRLLETILPDTRVTNEPKRQSCGAPDYILTKNEIPVGFIEAKNIGDKDLEGKSKSINKEQFDRYKASLNNLIFTDYIDFHFYQDGVFVTKIAVAELVNDQIKPLTENFETFTDLIRNFTFHKSQTIKSSRKLAEMMAGKARLLSDVIEKSLTNDESNEDDSTLKDQMKAFKDILIHDITPKGFADVYAQTIAYGLFAARLYDPTLNDFSRQEAAELIPKSNPFLRKLFGYIAGPDIDDRIKWIVDNLAEIFLACDVLEILKNYGEATKMEDPIIHFYEDFLAEYDPKLRKARGVWYTPAPVVSFIVRAVDDILKTEFDLPLGLADTSKTKITVNTQTPDKRSSTRYKKIEKEVHKVQILDPATGTGTFLAEVIRYVNKKFKGQEGIWSSYVEKDLIPRLNGFELLMASYAMAHLQLHLLLRETGFKPTKSQRTKIYLTNSLEESHPDAGTLFANWLSSEANEANQIKRDTPVMCIIGNPPYSGESANKGDWIMNLMEDYKKEPGGVEKLKERNPKWINDDYVKFLRFGQHYIEKNGSGILAYINPHGYLDNPTFRGMRWNLLKTYDKIYTIDLHGNIKKKEISPDGSPDINVFDIQQGVSINIFVKTGKKKNNQLGKVLQFDLFGKRSFKYDFLNNNSIKNIDFNQLPNRGPNYFMVQKDFDLEDEYNEGFGVSELFLLKSLGIQTHRDNFAIDFNKEKIKKRLKDFFNSSLSNEELINKYQLRETKEWQLNKYRDDTYNESNIKKIDYRFLDTRYTYYSRNIIDRDRRNVMQHLLKDNIAITLSKQLSIVGYQHIFLSKNIQESCLISLKTKEGGYSFPLYLYSDNNGQQKIVQNEERKPNLKVEVIKEIAEKLGLNFTNEKENTENTFAPIDILDYIYAVLHSPKYREKYKEFLKIDFPRVPYPKDKETFWQLVKLGGEIRQIHLLESSAVENYITTYPKDGSNSITTKVSKKDWELFDVEKGVGRIWINEQQYFDNVPLIAWEFYIGGYQPAQKWLKDRRERTLEIEDILHYQKIIVALSETDRLMKEIDKIEIVSN
jgi:predicted helicase